MNRAKIDISWRVVMGAVLLTGVVGCASYYRGGPPIYTSAYYQYPYRYHYYPSARIYYHISSGDYYYRDADHWKRARDLPPRHRLDRRDRVRIWSDADKPYSRHKEHREKFKPKPRRKHDSKRDPEERRDNQRLHERYRNR